MKSFFPKLWGGPNAVGESKLRGLEMTDAPYQTASGPGFIARKKGMFREVESTSSGPEPLLRFRIADVDPATAAVAVTEGFSVLTAVPHARPSIMLKLATVRDAAGTLMGAVRGATPYEQLANWVSADKKIVVSWRAWGRYATPDRIYSGTLNNVFSTAIPGTLVGTYYYGLSASSQWTPGSARIWVNGRGYNTRGLVFGACVVSMADADGVTRPFVKMVVSEPSWDPRQPDPIGPFQLVICPLDEIPTDPFRPVPPSPNYHAHDLRAGIGALKYRAGGTNVRGNTYDAPFLFNASGTEAVCSCSTGLDASPLRMGCPGVSAPTFTNSWPGEADTVEAGWSGHFEASVMGVGEGYAGTDERSYSRTTRVVVAADYLPGADTPTTLERTITDVRQYTSVGTRDDRDITAPEGPGMRYTYQGTYTEHRAIAYAWGDQTFEKAQLITLTRSSSYSEGSFGSSFAATDSASSVGLYNFVVLPLDLRFQLVRLYGSVEDDATATYANLASANHSWPANGNETRFDELRGNGLLVDVLSAFSPAPDSIAAQVAADPVWGRVVYSLWAAGGAGTNADGVYPVSMKAKCFLYEPETGATTLLADSTAISPNPLTGVPDDQKAHAYLFPVYAHGPSDGKII